MSRSRPSGTLKADFVERAARVAEEVAGPAADDVDRKARFPSEAFDALRDERLLSALIPIELGGEGATIRQIADVTMVLARHCASTAMIYAMHQMQVSCVVRHGRSALLRSFIREVAEGQLLLASATTELGVGGDVRTSICAVQREGGRFHLEKHAPVISYGEQADAILATARRDHASPPSDQVLVLCRRPGLVLEQIGHWDTLGFRGTCSPGFKLNADGDADAVLDHPFADISSQTMLPVSHVLWSSVWLGIATAAVERARRYVQAEARKQPGVTPPAALRLAELAVVHQQMQETIAGGIRRYEELLDDPGALGAVGFAIAMNTLKVSSSQLVVEIVTAALRICGIAGYRDDGPFGLGRLLRDAHGASLMVNNDRILGNNAQMLLVSREEL